MTSCYPIFNAQRCATRIVAAILVAAFFLSFAHVSSRDAVAKDAAQEDAEKGDQNDSESRDGEGWFNAESVADAADVEFRVDNTVRFIRNERESKYSSSTVFHGDLAFDFVGDNGEIVVYSFRAQKFVLIDPIRRMRSMIDESELNRFTERITAILREKEEKDGFATFMTDPSFAVSRKDDEFFFQSKWIDYRAKTVPFENERIADVYFRFVEAMGKLNVYMNPGALTPLARIEANRTFMEESRFPEKITTEIYPKGKTIFTKTYQIENESTLARRLSERDRNRVARAVQFFEQFQYVSFRTYFEKSSSR